MPLILPPDGPRGAALVEGLRDAILSGRLPHGTRLPPTRVLAEQLGLARGTVVGAYDELVSEGYCVARVGAGTFVAVCADMTVATTDGQPARLSAWGTRLAAGAAPTDARGAAKFDFRHGVAAEGFPKRALVLALRRAAEQLDREPGTGDPAGSMRLRVALATHLAQARGVRARPEQVLVVSGSQQGLDLATRLLLDAGDQVAFEEPGYPRARRVFEAARVALAPVAIDAQGLQPWSLPSAGSSRMVYVTPSHQYPTGAVLAAERRLELLRWAEQHDAWILEDDYDSEFRYGGPPLPCLQGLDRASRCLYLGSMSKLLHPALRIGYLVVPPSLVDVATKAKSALDQSTTPLIQEALADLFEQREIELHLRRATRAYRVRRNRLLTALAQHLPAHASGWPVTGGLHAFIHLADVEPAAMHAAAATHGIALTDAIDCYSEPPIGTPVILWFSRIAPERIAPGIAALSIAYHKARAHTPQRGRVLGYHAVTTPFSAPRPPKGRYGPVAESHSIETSKLQKAEG